VFDDPVKVVGKAASAAKRSASIATKAVAEFFRNGNNYVVRPSTTRSSTDSEKP
jgi:hypothetical protein